MGTFCSCFRAADVEEREESSTFNHRDITSPNCLMKILKYKYGAFLGGVSRHEVQSIENVASSSSTVSPNATQLDTNCNVTINSKSEISASHKELAIGKNQSDKNMHRRINLRISSRPVFENESKVHHSEDDEDVCPTCLEEYTLENPKIVIQCRHSYHLGCIYEWMERSEKCPICGKLMVFDDTARSLTSQIA